MNIIDRSPMKTSAQEALLAQSARRISEAKTAEEKASVVQNFAEQLRLEKLRAKRFQENMKEFNNAISGGPASLGGPPFPNGRHQVPTAMNVPSSKVKLTLVNPKSVGDSRFVLLRGDQQTSTSTWSNPLDGQFDLFRNGAGNVNALGSAMKSDYERNPGSAIADMRPKFNTMGSNTQQNGMLLAGGLQHVQSFISATNSSPSSSVTPSSRPLNVNAAPFVVQPKTVTPPAANLFPMQQPTPIGSGAVNQGLIRRMTTSPPITSPAVAVAPKSGAIDMNRQSRDQIPNIQSRPRSASIGGEQTQRPQIPGNMQPQVISGMGRGNDVIYYQHHKLTSPQPGRIPFSHLSKDSDLPKSQQQPEDVSKSRPPMGNVRIGGGSQLPNEDWDVEYAEPVQQQPKKDSPNVEKQAGFVTPSSVQKKDWLAVLKERDDIANHRYSREVMLRLTGSDASKIRPSHLSPEYNNDLGLWNPDLWFFINFQKDQPPPPAPVNRNPAMFGRGGSGSGAQDPPAGLRKVSCLSSLHQQGPAEVRRFSSN